MSAPAIPTIVVPCGTSFTLTAGFSLPVRLTCTPPDAGNDAGSGGGIVITLHHADHLRQFQQHPPDVPAGEAVMLRTSARMLSEHAHLGQIVTDLAQAGSPVTLLIEQ